MEPDSNGYRSSYRRLATLVVVLSLALVPLSGLGAAQQASAAGNQSYVAVQGEECTPITAFSDNESAIEYYDYRLPENFSDNPYVNATGTSFSSEGTTDLQAPNTSNVFLYTDTANDSAYLVFVHGAVDNESADGGVATFNVTGLPEDGNWTVRDDDYDANTSTDNWTVTNTTSTVDWDWDEEATDGGVYSGIDNDTNVTIEPAFNEDAEMYGSADGVVESWQVLSNDSDNVTRTDLELNETLQISAGTCDDVDADDTDTDTDDTDTDTDDTDDTDTDTDEPATVNFEDQESDGTTVTVDNVTVPEDGYVAIHNDSLLDGDAVGSVIGVSEYLEAGTYDNLTVELFDVPGAEFDESELTENGTLIAMPHEETTGDESYDFVSSNGTDDGPYTDGGEAVTDDADITVGNDTDENETDETAAVTFDDQETDGTSVTVQNVTVPEDGHVAIHNDTLLDGDAVGSVIGVSEYLEAGDYEDIEVELFDVPGAEFDESELTESATLIAMPHEETTDDESYDFVSSNGTDDGPYTDGGEAVTDDADVTVVNDTDENETETPADDTPTDTPEDDTPTDTPADDTPTDTPADDTPTDTPADDTSTDTPADDTPTDTPADDTPVDDGTPTDTPADDTPTDTPADDTPADDTPTDTPADDTPTDTPADDTPTDDGTPTDTPADDTPTDTPADDTPADDTPTDTPADDTPEDDDEATPTDDGGTASPAGTAGE
ncbi:DUF7282 domain-containing protein [Haloarcula sediminis]|uniref:DUF7282 domain-containing protein n=1 Tax=Haloarcula sediminis TaxID=3111777 RepID=UPI002D77FFF1|nr:hypothetical protein [Haloarcula sp. CK38]